MGLLSSRTNQGFSQVIFHFEKDARTAAEQKADIAAAMDTLQHETPNRPIGACIERIEDLKVPNGDRFHIVKLSSRLSSQTIPNAEGAVVLAYYRNGETSESRLRKYSEKVLGAADAGACLFGGAMFGLAAWISSSAGAGAAVFCLAGAAAATGFGIRRLYVTFKQQ